MIELLLASTVVAVFMALVAGAWLTVVTLFYLVYRWTGGRMGYLEYLNEW